MSRVTDWKLAELGGRVQPLPPPLIRHLISLRCSWIPHLSLTGLSLLLVLLGLQSVVCTWKPRPR